MYINDLIFLSSTYFFQGILHIFKNICLRNQMFFTFIRIIFFFLVSNINKIYTGWVKKKVWFAAPGAKLYLFCATLLYGVFLNIFWKFIIFFGTSMAQKKICEPFSLKIKSSEKQKCVNKLFLSKFKILKRLNHRIPENLQNWN